MRRLFGAFFTPTVPLTIRGVWIRIHGIGSFVENKDKIFIFNSLPIPAPRVALAPSGSCALGTASPIFSAEKIGSGVRLSITGQRKTPILRWAFSFG
jgi:hypothetical protein